MKKLLKIIKFIIISPIVFVLTLIAVIILGIGNSIVGLIFLLKDFKSVKIFIKEMKKKLKDDRNKNS